MRLYYAMASLDARRSILQSASPSEHFFSTSKYIEHVPGTAYKLSQNHSATFIMCVPFSFRVYKLLKIHLRQVPYHAYLRNQLVEVYDVYLEICR